MRISNSITYNDFLRNLGTNASKVQSTLNQLSSLKEVSKSSDNPLLVSKIMDLNVSLNQNKTYNNTIKDSISWTKAQDSALESVSTSMLRIRSLVQSSANATAGSEELGANRSTPTLMAAIYLAERIRRRRLLRSSKKMTPSSVSNTMAPAKTCREKSQMGSRWIC